MFRNLTRYLCHITAVHKRFYFLYYFRIIVSEPELKCISFAHDYFTKNWNGSLKI